jgi:hypothetical protein
VAVQAMRDRGHFRCVQVRRLLMADFTQRLHAAEPEGPLPAHLGCSATILVPLRPQWMLE